MTKTEQHKIPHEARVDIKSIRDFYAAVSEQLGEIPDSIGLGTDIELVARIAKYLDSDYYLLRTFTPDEIAYCEQFGNRKSEHYAGKFAAKEAVIKSLGGIRNKKKTEIEIRNNENGAPFVVLEGNARLRADTLGVGYFLLSVSHVPSVAVAVCVAVGKKPRE